MASIRSLIRSFGSYSLLLALLAVPAASLPSAQVPIASEEGATDLAGSAPQPAQGESSSSDGAPTKGEEKQPRGMFIRALTWLWNLVDGENQLGKAAVFAIALLSAFLTVVEVWQIPPPRSRSAGHESGKNQSASNSEGSPDSEAENNLQIAKPTESSPAIYGGTALLFHSNFARTVLGGLAGMTLVAAFDEMWKNESSKYSEEAYYLVLFVVFFLTILLSTSVVRGFGEAIRSRVVVARRTPPFKQPFARLWAWILSLRVPLLVFFDTSFNLVQGKNQLQTEAFSREIVELHRSLVLAVERIRKQLDVALLEAIKDARGKRSGASICQDSDLRVSISLMTQDEQRVFYVSREVGSLARPFEVHSLAWLSIKTGQPLWYEGTFPLDARVCKNPGGLPRDFPNGIIHFKDAFEERPRTDYEAFVILPLPWANRGEAEGYRKAGIHISFSRKTDMEKLWPEFKAPPGEVEDIAGLDILGRDGNGLKEHQKLAGVLQTSATVLNEILRHFNDLVFEEQLRPYLRPA